MTDLFQCMTKPTTITTTTTTTNQKLTPKEDMYLMENKREGYIKKKKICGGMGTESYFVIFLPGNENLLV